MTKAKELAHRCVDVMEALRSGFEFLPTGLTGPEDIYEFFLELEQRMMERGIAGGVSFKITPAFPKSMEKSPSIPQIETSGTSH